MQQRTASNQLGCEDSARFVGIVVQSLCTSPLLYCLRCNLLPHNSASQLGLLTSFNQCCHFCCYCCSQGQGLSEKQMRLCDGFVYIPQHGPGTASLNVTVAASIVLHHFAVWAGYQERQREGAKFNVDPKPQRTTPRGIVPLTAEEQESLRLQRQGLGLGAETKDAAAGEQWLQEAMQEHGGVDGLLEAVAGCAVDG